MPLPNILNQFPTYKSSTMSDSVNPQLIDNLVLYQPMTFENSLPPFNQINDDMYLEILSYLNREDLIRLRLVCCFFYEKAIPQLRYIILCILNELDNPLDFFAELKEFYKANRKFMFPFVYPEVKFVIPGQPCEIKSPMVAIFTANGEMPEEIDTSQVRCIGNSSKEPLPPKHSNWEHPFHYKFHTDEFLYYLKSNREKLTNLIALIMRHRIISSQKLEGCSIIEQFEHVDIKGSDVYDDEATARYEYERYAFRSNKFFAATMDHSTYCPAFIFPNLEKCILHLKETDIPLERESASLLHFDANLCPKLKQWEVLCHSTAYMTEIEIGLSRRQCCTEAFICNATPRQARFTVYGTEYANGLFIPGNNNWASGLRYALVRHDFIWHLETSKGVFKPYCFKNVTMREDAIVEYYNVKIEYCDSVYDPSCITSDDVIW